MVVPSKMIRQLCLYKGDQNIPYKIPAAVANTECYWSSDCISRHEAEIKNYVKELLYAYIIPSLFNNSII